LCRRLLFLVHEGILLNTSSLPGFFSGAPDPDGKLFSEERDENTVEDTVEVASLTSGLFLPP
jgi:hypothetical protein